MMVKWLYNPIIDGVKSLIKNIMNDFLYTFSSKQISAELPNEQQDRPCTIMQDPARRVDIGLKNIRTKRMKRYEKVFEHTGIRKHLTEPENEFMGLENIASETLVRLS